MDTAYTPKRICDENKSMFVPIYQRLFVWDDKQIMRLLEDLFAASQMELNGDYYVGIVTIRERPEDGRWELVDGQQRLTFFTLFAAMQHAVAYDANLWRKFLFLGNGDLRIDYAGRSCDREYIKLLANPPEDQKEEKVNNANMRRFRACWKLFERERLKDDKDKITKFSKYVFEHASFLVSCLPGNYSALDLNRFFEKMNSAGRQLSVCDVIKGTYFPEAAKVFDDCLNFEKKLVSLDESYKNFQIDRSSRTGSENNSSILDVLKEGTIRHSEPKEGEVGHHGVRSILSDEMLLLHVLCLLGSSPNQKSEDGKPVLTIGSEDSLSGQFTKLEKEKLKDFLLKLVDYRKWLDDNIVHIEYDAHGRVSYELGYVVDQKEDADLIKLKQFQAMMYVSSSLRQDWILKAYLKCKELCEDKKDCPKVAFVDLETLRKIDGEVHKLPEKYEGFGRYPNIDRYWFWRLDYVLWCKYFDFVNNGSVSKAGVLEEGIPSLEKEELEHVIGYVFRPNRSIEHLHPQTPQDENTESEDWRQERKKDDRGMIDSFGNLAMISSSLNSAQQNDGVGIKFERLKEKVSSGSGGLESIKMYLMFKLAKENPGSWSVALSRNHGKKMFELLKADVLFAEVSK